MLINLEGLIAFDDTICVFVEDVEEFQGNNLHYQTKVD